jgi:hypothetical protein
VLVAAAVCPATPLLARPLTGADPVLPELRDACRAAAAALVAARPGLVAVAGVAAEGREWDPSGRLDLAAFAPALGRDAGPDRAAALPASLGLGSLLLDQAGQAGPRLLVSVTEDDPVARCVALGERLAGLADRVALLVMADGSARRTLKAPGYLDGRSLEFDDAVELAIRAGDLVALAKVDAALARDLMATGRAPWQVLAGAAGGQAASSEVRYRADPFGVWYLVASLAFRGEDPVRYHG